MKFIFYIGINQELTSIKTVEYIGIYRVIKYSSTYLILCSVINGHIISDFIRDWVNLQGYADVKICM